MEVELKLLVDPEDAAALQQHRLLKQYATSAPHEQMMSDTYFDTPDLHIRRCDAVLRVRRVDNNDWVQTMKGADHPHGGLHCRQEWASRVSGPVPNLAVLSDVVDAKTPWSRLLRSPVVEDRLAPIFKTEVKRTVWELRLPQGDEVECILDQGNVEHDNQTVPISEIELELKSGDPVHLFDFALALQQDIPLHIGQLSKADRGYALLTPPAPLAVKAARLDLSPKMTIDQVFQAIAFNCITQIQANEAGVAAQHDVESLHQMRVGLRRLHSAFTLFRDVLQPPETLQSELDWLATELGAARDWDVLVGATLPSVATVAPDETGLAELQRLAQVRAQEQHNAAAVAIQSPRYTRLILNLTRWIQGRGWCDTLTPADQARLTARIPKFARNMLIDNQNRLLKRARQLRGANPVALHRIRIAAKKARYATEFFQSLYPKKKVRPYVAALSVLQDEFGWRNDASVAEGLLKQWQEKEQEQGQEQHSQATLASSTGFIRGYLTSQVQNSEQTMCRLWKKFTRMPLPCQSARRGR